MERNNIPSPDLIVEGRTLIIPAPGAAPAPQAVERPIAQRAEASPASRIPSTAPDRSSVPHRTEKSTGVVPHHKEEQRHVVQKGEILSKIAARYNVRPEAVMRRNDLSSPDLIVVGRTLIIPAPVK